MKIAIFIDGSNFYSKLKELKIKHTSKFDYYAFVLSLTKGIKPTYAGYYVGQVRKEKNNPKSELLYSHQQKLFAHLQTRSCSHIIFTDGSRTFCSVQGTTTKLY